MPGNRGGPARPGRNEKEISKIIRPKVDQLRYDYLCKECLEKVEYTSGVAALGETSDWKIV